MLRGAAWVVIELPAPDDSEPAIERSRIIAKRLSRRPVAELVRIEEEPPHVFVGFVRRDLEHHIVHMLQAQMLIVIGRLERPRRDAPSLDRSLGGTVRAAVVDEIHLCSQPCVNALRTLSATMSASIHVPRTAKRRTPVTNPAASDWMPPESNCLSPRRLGTGLEAGDGNAPQLAKRRRRKRAGTRSDHTVAFRQNGVGARPRVTVLRASYGTRCV